MILRAFNGVYIPFSSSTTRSQWLSSPLLSLWHWQLLYFCISLSSSFPIPHFQLLLCQCLLMFLKLVVFFLYPPTSDIFVGNLFPGKCLHPASEDHQLASLRHTLPCHCWCLLSYVVIFKTVNTISYPCSFILGPLQILFLPFCDL